MANEAFAQGGSSLIIKCLTDNPNRTVSFVKTAFNKCGAKLASQNSVSFMYEHLGVIGIKGHAEEEVMDALRLLTHDKDEDYMEYVKQIKTNEIARKVKIIDFILFFIFSS